MDKVLYLAANGANEIMRAQANNANNLANANTVGFREDFSFAKAAQVTGTGYQSRAYSVTEGHGANLSPGSMLTTGRELDVAIRGEGWLAVQGMDGTEAFTRAGDLRVTPAGLLTTAAGHPVIGNNGGPITIPPADKIEIGADGTVSVRPRGQEPTTLVIVDRIKMVNPDPTAIGKGMDGLFRMKDGSVIEPDAGVQIISGVLESSNVNVVESMVTMMELARKFELQIKVMENINKIDESSQQIMKFS